MRGGRSAADLQGERDKAARAVCAAHEALNWQPAGACSKGEELLEACGSKDAAEALLLIGEGADPDCVDDRGWSPLIFASYEEELDGVAARLIAAGAKLDLVNNDGDTALISACLFGRVALALLLVKAGAALDIVSGDDGHTALHWADKHGLTAVSAAIRARGGRTGAELAATTP